MSQLPSRADKASGGVDPTETVVQRLREAEVGVERSASVEDGTKKCYNHENLRSPTEITGNYNIFGGDGLVILDVDVTSEEFDDLPEWVSSLPPTLVIKSPHGGYHPYYAVEDDTGISNTKTDWGSIRYGWYALGPGSTIDHSQCDDGKEGCPGEGIGEYEIATNNPKATLSGEDLEDLREACDSDCESRDTADEEFRDITVDDDLIEQAEENIRYFQANSTLLAFQDLIDLLCGGTGSISGLRHDDDSIDRDKADLEALWMLYGVMRYADEDEEDAAELTYASFTHYCEHEEYMKDGRKRKWLTRPESYRRNRLNTAIDGFEMGDWHHWRLRKHDGGFDPSNPEHYRGEREYAGLKKRLAVAIVDIYSGLLNVEDAESVYDIDLSSPPRPSCHNMGPGGGHGPIAGSSGDCPFPTPKEVKEALMEVDQICSERTAENVIRDLRKEGRLKWAELERGVDYRIYPDCCPDPSSAERVKTGGEEYVPDTESDGSSEEESEQEIMTDGGTSMSKTESHNDLKRIRRAKNGEGNDTQGPEVYACPIAGCDRVVVGNPGPLRNHVSQSSDAQHRHRSLNDDLEVVTAYGVRWIGDRARPSNNHGQENM